jgi:hypothetical protein
MKYGRVRSTRETPMGHALEISQEAYVRLREAAERRGQTPEALVEAWTAQLANLDADRDPFGDPHYETFEESFLGLGMSDADIEMAKRSADDGDT